MSACREGFNLFNSHGRYHLWKEIRRCIKNSRIPVVKRIKYFPWEYTLKDSFGRFICKIIGHNRLFICSDPGEPVEFSCHRCYRKVEEDSISN